MSWKVSNVILKFTSAYKRTLKYLLSEHGAEDPMADHTMIKQSRFIYKVDNERVVVGYVFRIPTTI